MRRTRLSSKGQIVLPREVRDEQGWTTGTQFIVESKPGAVTLRPVSPAAATTVEDVSGCLRYKGRPKSIAEMERAVVQEVRRRHGRGRY